jgi:hypothetical protein
MFAPSVRDGEPSLSSSPSVLNLCVPRVRTFRAGVLEDRHPGDAGHTNAGLPSPARRRLRTGHIAACRRDVPSRLSRTYSGGYPRHAGPRSAVPRSRSHAPQARTPLARPAMSATSDKGRAVRHDRDLCLGAGGRLTDTARRYVELNGEPRRPGRYPLELIAREIRRHDGNVWPAVRHFGVSYEHALRVRNGWRGAGRPRARRIEYALSRNVGRRSPELRVARA